MFAPTRLFTATLFLAVSGLLQAQTEIVIGVPEAEARAVLQAFAVDELRYEELFWRSNGRIRVAKINIDALKQGGNEVQFTPFPDVDPITLLSHGVTVGQYGHITWTGERAYNRVDGLPDRQTLEDGLAAEPDMIAMGAANAEHITAEIVKEFETVNTVTLNIGSVLMDADTREFLFNPNGRNAENYLINPETGETHSTDRLESSYKWLVGKAGIEYPCEKRAIPKRGPPPGALAGADFGTTDGLMPADGPILDEGSILFEGSIPVDGMMEFGMAPSLPPGMVPAPDFIDQKTGHVTNSKHGYVFAKKSGEVGVTVPCKPPGDVLDRLANLPGKYREWSSARNYERIKPLPASARYFESIGGSIRDKSISPMIGAEEYNAVGAKIYRVNRFNRHPEYVLIYELDASRRAEPMMIDDHRNQDEIDAWQSSPEMVAYRKTDKYRLNQENIASRKAHMARAKARIDARGRSTDRRRDRRRGDNQ